MSDTSFEDLLEENTFDEELSLFARNIKAFEEHLPVLAPRIEDHRPMSKLVYLENGEPSIEFDQTKVYPRGAETETREQLDRYGIYSRRLTVIEVTRGGLDDYAGPAFEKLERRFKDAGYRYGPIPVRDDSYFLIVTGVGLGLHLKELIERTKCRVLIIIEPNMDLLHQSCHVCDWSDVLGTMAERGAVEVLTASDVSYVSAVLQSIFRQYNPMMFDGTTVFNHYRSSFTDEVEREFSDKMQTAIMGLGFFQDEMNMIGQTYKNLEGGTTRLVQEINESPQMPCMIVGSGPSLESVLPFLKENQDKYVIFSSGSALTVLARNGIKSDFWVMTERIKDVVTMVNEAHEEFDVSDVTFIGSSTVYPGVTDPFNEFILFLRPGLSVAPLFKTREDQILIIPDPLAANSSLAAALHMGFREVYLVGVDAGSKYQDKGHASGGYYEGRDDHLKHLDMPTPGNFGGTVWTIPTLQWSRENIEKLLLLKAGRQVYNLSDGALIKHTTPMHYKAVRPKTPAKPKSEVVQELTTKCAVFSTEEFEDRWDNTALIDRLPEFCENLKGCVIDDDLEDYRYARNIAELLKPSISVGPIEMLVRGTVAQFMIGYLWYANRFVDNEEREVAKTIFKEEYEALLDRMTRRAVEVFEGLEEGEPWEEFID